MRIQWLLHRLARQPDAPALIWRGTTYSYRRLLDEVAVASRRLDAEGIAAGQVVAVQGSFSPTACALLLALLDRRAIVVPLTSATRGQWDEFLETAEAQAVIPVNEIDRWTCQPRPRVITHPLLRHLIAQRDPGLILFTSGSTGQSKAALHNVTALLQKYRTPRRARRTLTFLLFDHIGGLNTLFHTLANGGTIVTVERHDPEIVCQAIQRHAVELLPTSPTFLNLLLVSEAYRQYDLSSLELITYGTEVMPDTTLRRLREEFPAMRFLQTYGLSELGILQSWSKDSGSLLVKVGGEGFETKIVEGTLWVRSQSAMMGYLNAPSPFNDEGWMNTGDAVEVEGDYLRILGRKSEIINIGGQKVHPAEVESVLMQIDNIRDASVYGEKNPLMGSIVATRLTLDQPENLTHLRRRIWTEAQGRLAAYKIPQKITIVDFNHLHTPRFKKIRRHQPLPEPAQV